MTVWQVWRPIKGPVKSSPLGVIDVSTVKKEDLISYPLYFKDRIGYNYGVKYSPNHRYILFPLPNALQGSLISKSVHTL